MRSMSILEEMLEIISLYTKKLVFAMTKVPCAIKWRLIFVHKTQKLLENGQTVP
jgi:hypothetical protein